MPSNGSRTARTLLAAGTLAAALALTACDPEAGPGADTAQAGSPTTAAPTTAAPDSPTAAPSATAKQTGKPGGGKHTVISVQHAAGLTKSSGDGAISDVPVDPGEMRDGMNLVVENYDRAGQTSGRRILFVGVDNVPEDTNKRREHLWRGLIDYAAGNGSTGTPGTGTAYAPGPLGGSLECLPYGADALCGWADSSTAAVALFPQSSPAQAAKLFASMRADLEQ
ncbi:hypothetical protein [Kitasatospora sp. DSM 101779]|uniref:hypothetical protein n=1 Tax=Kitasatospora sp. DSM 101779 TaxID=2853165 RepID=UPI0021DACFB1|nr:hypothetical protein [Kitasatospora sp. DSM 101779]MCU7824612.1 hypothetical protein [Kitasatospora sp. DSM 101779]